MLALLVFALFFYPNLTETSNNTEPFQILLVGECLAELESSRRQTKRRAVPSCGSAVNG